MGENWDTVGGVSFRPLSGRLRGRGLVSYR